MDADAVHTDADRAGGFAEVAPGGVDASLLVVVLLDVVPVRDVGMTHADSIRPSSASKQHSDRPWPAEPGRGGCRPLSERLSTCGTPSRARRPASRGGHAGR